MVDEEQYLLPHFLGKRFEAKYFMFSPQPATDHREEAAKEVTLSLTSNKGHPFDG